jgi:hypothetical protein
MINPGKKAAPESNKRKASRYGINPTFPVKAVLSLIDKNAHSGVASHGKIGFKTQAWKDWTGTLVDLSATGANMHVNLAAVAFPDDVCRLKLSLGSYKIEIPGTVAHFLCYSQYANCGVQFTFPDAESEKAYFQVLEPVIIGTSLAPVEARADNSGRHKEQYAGKNSSMLTIWRATPGGDVVSFDFRMNRYGVRWSSGLTELTPYSVDTEAPTGSKAAVRPTLKLKMRAPEKPAGGSSSAPLTEAQDEEVRWLFCLAVSNLSMSVAEDVRTFLLSTVIA